MVLFPRNIQFLPTLPVRQPLSKPAAVFSLLPEGIGPFHLHGSRCCCYLYGLEPILVAPHGTCTQHCDPNLEGMSAPLRTKSVRQAPSTCNSHRSAKLRSHPWARDIAGNGPGVATAGASGCFGLRRRRARERERERKGEEGRGRERKGEEGRGRERKGEEGRGRERKGEEGRGRERKGEEGRGRERKGEEGRGRKRKGEEGRGREKRNSKHRIAQDSTGESGP